MSSNFPPQSTHLPEIEVLSKFLHGVIQESNAVYVSSPITSGQRYIEWIKTHPTNRDFSGDNQTPEFISNVIEKNLGHAKTVVKKIRALFPGKILIDPTAVPDIDGWKQGDYRYAWGRVIEEFADLVVFSDDWQFSSGCIYEYLISMRGNIKVIDEKQEEITPAIALTLIRDAMETLETYDLPVDFHEAIYSELGG